ncbi:hypothetical protein PENSPDRAFT_655841 [Peniophora sp. CONT]|nr:hypothetical protein PENSPDRAFT_655841 [Peniophora sp. CONT]
MSAAVATATAATVPQQRSRPHRITFSLKAIKSALPSPKALRRRSQPIIPQVGSDNEKRTTVLKEDITVIPVNPVPITPPAQEEEVATLNDDASFHLPSPTRTPQIGAATTAFTAMVPSSDKAAIAGLIAEYGSSSSTSWLEFSRYKIWRPTVPIKESSFVPVQGYLRAEPYVFAWGNPLVSDKAALQATAQAFWDWAKGEGLKAVWCCVDDDMEAVLGGAKLGWSTLSCIVEDTLDPKTVVDLANASGNAGGSEVKDFKKNLRRAERSGVTVQEVKYDAFTDEKKKEVEDGILAWKKAKAKTGLQLASTSFMPWLDAQHRRYWIAESEGHVVGILVLTQIHHNQWQIKNAASFPDAPRGTSEWLIFQAMDALNGEDCLVWEQARGRSDEHVSSRSPSGSRDSSVTPTASADGHSESTTGRAVVTFGITASETLSPSQNLNGWRVSALSATYNKVVGSTGLTRRGDFRSKFHTVHQRMYVCYPAKQGFGLDGVSKLIKALRQ